MNGLDTFRKGPEAQSNGAQALVHTIFRPANSEELLRGWLLHAHKGRRRHDLAARCCDRTRLWLGGAAAALAAIVGTSGFVALQTPQAGQPVSSTAVVLVVTMSMLAAVLTSLSAFMNFAERAERHRATGVHYKSMIRELERILSVPGGAMPGGVAGHEVEAIQKRLNELEEDAPVVPVRIYDQVEVTWNDKNVEFVQIAEKLYPRRASTDGGSIAEGPAMARLPTPTTHRTVDRTPQTENPV